MSGSGQISQREDGFVRPGDLRDRASLRRKQVRWLACAAVLAAAAVFMFFDFKTPPIVLWDESRQAVNALEMRRHGLSLVVTYGFQPDLWNTKPPLLIWAMWAAMSLFGDSELSLRLPSMLAAIGALALTWSFTRRATRSLATAALAVFLLGTSFSFFGEFGARTGDYDALLCLLCTSYLYVLFFQLHRRRPDAGVAGAGLLVAAAVLTKGVAGLLPGGGVVIYLLASGRWRRPLQSRWYVAGVACAVIPVALFLVLREHAQTGYLHAALFNDITGRFSSAFDHHVGPPWFYVETTFILAFFSVGPLATLSPVALLAERGVARQALVYSFSIAGVVLGVLSLSATKLNHYALIAYPFIAVATAIAARAGFRSLAKLRLPGVARFAPALVASVLMGALLGLVALRALWFRAVYLPGREFYPKAAYGQLFQSMRRQGIDRLTVVDRGSLLPGQADVSLSNIPIDYAPQLWFYTLLWRDRGVTAERIAPAALVRVPQGAVAASCDPKLRRAVLALGADMAMTPGCVAVRVAK
jgi:4-amino-4-deoxy-L-arabinose transferase-like glycosyltransferase